MGRASKGFSIAVSEQFVPYGTVQSNGKTLPPSDLDKMFLDKSTTHIVPAWSFSQRFGVSLSLPVIHQRFREMHLLVAHPFVVATSGEEAGIGDLSLIERYTAFQAGKGQAAVSLNLLAGMKFPTGDTSGGCKMFPTIASMPGSVSVFESSLPQFN